MRILGPASADIARVKTRIIENFPTHHPRFREDMVNALWEAAERYGIDPVGMVAQAGKETGFGRYGGKVLPEWHNPCGLKTRYTGMFPGVDDGDNPLAHERFANWDVGATAMAQHLRAYTGVKVRDLIVDPRYVHVIGKYRIQEFRELSGKWAIPGTLYGTEIEGIAARLI